MQPRYKGDNKDQQIKWNKIGKNTLNQFQIQSWGLEIIVDAKLFNMFKFEKICAFCI